MVVAVIDMRLRKERKKAGLTQSELSRLSRVAQSTISKLESSERQASRFDTLQKLAYTLQRRGRRVTAVDLLPSGQPALIKGFRSDRKRKRAAA